MRQKGDRKEREKYAREEWEERGRGKQTKKCEKAERWRKEGINIWVARRTWVISSVWRSSYFLTPLMELRISLKTVNLALLTSLRVQPPTVEAHVLSQHHTLYRYSRCGEAWGKETITLHSLWNQEVLVSCEHFDESSESGCQLKRGVNNRRGGSHTNRTSLPHYYYNHHFN